MVKVIMLKSFIVNKAILISATEKVLNGLHLQIPEKYSRNKFNSYEDFLWELSRKEPDPRLISIPDPTNPDSKLIVHLYFHDGTEELHEDLKVGEYYFVFNEADIYKKTYTELGEVIKKRIFEKFCPRLLL